MIKQILLTKENFLKVGQQIMADERVTDDIKAAVRRAVSGQLNSDNLLTFYVGVPGSSKTEWWEDIAVNLGEQA